MFPDELWIAIFSSLPLASHEDISGPLTLAHTARVSVQLKQVANDQSLWKSHYHAKWKHSHPRNEQERQKRLRHDFRLMYAERQLMDDRAIRLLDSLVNATQEKDRAQHASDIATALGYDVWDAINAVSTISVPSKVVSLSTSTPLPINSWHPLARRYWANELKDLIMRRLGLQRWLTLFRPSTQDALFEEHLVVLSTLVAGHDPFELTQEFERLGQRCKADLSARALEYRSKDNEYSLEQLIEAICAWMRLEGFDAATPDESYHELSNSFPHTFLNSHRKTIPLSLVCVFVSLARCFGLRASPVNFPQKVICHVANPDGSMPDVWVDVYGSATRCILDFQQLLAEGEVNATSYIEIMASTAPAAIPAMLIRSGNNILNAIHMFTPTTSEDVRMTEMAFYTAACIMCIFAGRVPLLTAVLAHNEEYALDRQVVLLDTILPLLPPSPQVLEAENSVKRAIGLPQPVKRRRGGRVKYAVGLVMRHKRYDYTGVILGWDRTCQKGEDWMTQMRVDELSGGRHQPFYHVAPLAGPYRYVAEENIEIVRLDWDLAGRLMREVRSLGRYFGDVEIAEEGEIRSGGFRVTEYVKRGYPEDEEVARVL